MHDTLTQPRNLTKLAKGIRDAHLKCEGCATASIRYAIKAGKLLIEAKQQVGHGKWLAWIKENCQFSDDTAGRYMRIAASPNSAHVRNLSIREALKLLSSTKDEADGKPPKPLTEIDVIDGIRGHVWHYYEKCPPDLRFVVPAKLREYADLLERGKELNW